MSWIPNAKSVSAQRCGQGSLGEICITKDAPWLTIYVVTQKTLAAVNHSQPTLAAATPSSSVTPRGLASAPESGTESRVPPNDNIMERSSPSVGTLHATSTTLFTTPTATSTAKISASRETVVPDADAVATYRGTETDGFPMTTTSIHQLLQLQATIQQRQLEQQLFGTMEPPAARLVAPLPDTSDDEDLGSDEASDTEKNGARVSI